MRTFISVCMGRKVQPRFGITLASKRTVTMSSSTRSAPLVATWVVPAKPVTWQNQE